MTKEISNLKMGKSWTSYIAAVAGVLKAGNFYSDDIWKLMGHTGIAFHFIIHKQLCPSSITVYNWAEEHFSMLDRIGVFTTVRCYMDNYKYNTLKEIQSNAIKEIKESIDNGFGVVIWAPSSILEFGIIYGYDDEDGVFLVKDVTGDEIDPMLYSNLGRSNVPILFYQIVHSKTKLKETETIIDSLKFAVYEWNKKDHNSEEYSSGRKGYGNLFAALENRDFNSTGLSYILAVYSDSKKACKLYLEYINHNKKINGKLNKAANNYSKVSQIFSDLHKEMPFPYNNEIDDLLQIIDKLKLCMKLEDEAIANIDQFLGEINV